MTDMNLRKLDLNQKARIVSVNTDGELARRICDMGLLPGVEFTVIGHAPLKDPVALRLLGYTLTLRNNEADVISVELLEPSKPVGA